jgi:hypothetical protein
MVKEFDFLAMAWSWLEIRLPSHVFQHLIRALVAQGRPFAKTQRVM